MVRIPGGACRILMAVVCAMEALAQHLPLEYPQVVSQVRLWRGLAELLILSVCTMCLKAIEFSKIRLLPEPFRGPGMGLGGHLVTIRVLEHPWGPT